MKESTKDGWWQSLKYLLLSVSAGAIQLVVFTILNEFVFKDGEYGPSYFIALAMSVIYNFTLNREYTFKSANNVKVAMLLVGAYYLVFTPLSIWGGEALENAGWNEYIVLGITMVINFVTEFLYWKFVVYKNSQNTNKRALNKISKTTASINNIETETDEIKTDDIENKNKI